MTPNDIMLPDGTVVVPAEESELVIEYADVAAAAITALQAVVSMLPDDAAAQVLEAFEARARQLKAADTEDPT